MFSLRCKTPSKSEDLNLLFNLFVKMIVKIHSTHDGKKIVAICDNNLLGKRFVEGNKQLDLTGDFYRGEEKGEKEIMQLLSNAYVVNFVGVGSVGFGKRIKIVSSENVIVVDNIPHAQVILL